MDGSEFRVFEWSQVVMRRMMASPRRETEEIIFLEFRPGFLVLQSKVYVALPVRMCAICMVDVYVENLATQHNLLHPPICRTCFAKLHTCPFCRARLSVVDDLIQLRSYRGALT